MPPTSGKLSNTACISLLLLPPGMITTGSNVDFVDVCGEVAIPITQLTHSNPAPARAKQLILLIVLALIGFLTLIIPYAHSELPENYYKTQRKMSRLYLIPVKYKCNANCIFCITEEEKVKPAFSALPEFIKLEELKVLLAQLQPLRLTEIEITGGGEPLLHPQLQDIINLVKGTWPGIYVKLYTNGLLLKNVRGINELNLSRAHPDAAINNQFFGVDSSYSLIDLLNFYRPLVKLLRVQVPLLQGGIDSAAKAIRLATEVIPPADQVVLRPLFSKCGKAKELVVQFPVTHPGIKLDQTGDYCGTRPVIASDARLYWDWTFTKSVLTSELDQLDLELNQFLPTRSST